MAHRGIDTVSTIADIVGNLRKPEDYLCGVLKHMIECEHEHGNALVVIAVTGKGRAPHYRVEYTDDDHVSWIWDTFHGRGHKKFLKLSQLHDSHWSQFGMSLSDIQKLLHDVRSHKTVHRRDEQKPRLGSPPLSH